MRYLRPLSRFRPIFPLSFLMLLSIGIASAQIDPDPNSPAPILFSGESTTRVLLDADGVKGEEQTPRMNSTIRVFIGGIVPMAGEGADSVRFHAQDSRGRLYRFPVLALSPISVNGETIYAATIELRDELRFWPQPADGILVVRVSWRGSTSNRLKLVIGSTRDDAPNTAKDLVPMPISSITDVSRTSAAGTEADGDLMYVGYRWAGDRRRFMEQAGFGPTEILDQRLRRIGIRTWLAEQFDAPYPTPGNPYPDIPLRSTSTSHATLGCGMFVSNTPEYRNCTRTHYNMYPVQNWFFKEAFYGDSQLRHRVSWALSQMWVISGSTTQQSSWMIAYHKILSQNAFGNYRQLMKEVTVNPAMGNYLDMRRSTRNNPNENYPRELLQLFTVGTVLLNPNGTPILQGGEPIPTYDQETVNNFTKVFTGWRLCGTIGPNCPNAATDIANYKDPMELNASNHNLEAKTLFDYPGSTTTNLPACAGCTGTTRENYAKDSLEQALDNIFYHPNVGPFVSKFLIQHLVMSDPSPAYVGRVSAVFSNNGAGVRGDMQAVVRAILLDPEARGDVKTDPSYGKLREPVQMITNFARHLGVRGANDGPISDGVVNGLSSPLGQNTFYSPSVFNYYPPGYVVPGSAIPGPEFALMNTGTSVGRANLVNTLVFGQIGTSESVPLGTSLDMTEMTNLAATDPTGTLLVDTLDKRMLHGTMSPEMRTSILTAFTAITPSNPLQRARQAVYLVASSSQFQVQR